MPNSNYSFNCVDWVKGLYNFKHNDKNSEVRFDDTNIGNIKDIIDTETPYIYQSHNDNFLMYYENTNVSNRWKQALDPSSFLTLDGNLYEFKI